MTREEVVLHYSEVILADCSGGPDMGGCPPGRDTLRIALERAFDAGRAMEREAVVAWLRAHYGLTAAAAALYIDRDGAHTREELGDGGEP